MPIPVLGEVRVQMVSLGRGALEGEWGTGGTAFDLPY